MVATTASFRCTSANDRRDGDDRRSGAADDGRVKSESSLFLCPFGGAGTGRRRRVLAKAPHSATDGGGRIVNSAGTERSPICLARASLSPFAIPRSPKRGSARTFLLYPHLPQKGGRRFCARARNVGTGVFIMRADGGAALRFWVKPPHTTLAILTRKLVFERRNKFPLDNSVVVCLRFSNP
ncbi:hypothetical protein MRX96_034116 [Rhipicephalus microplus]